MTFLILGIFLTFILCGYGLESKEESSEPRLFSGEVIDLGNTYDFLTTDDVSYRFTAILIFQFIFSAVGWFSFRALWTLIRGDAVSSDPELSSLSDFLLSDQTAVSNVALGVLYALAGAVVWIVLSQLGSPTNAKKRSDNVKKSQNLNGKIVEDIGLYDASQITEKTDAGFNLVEVLDGAFGFAQILRVNLINAVLTTAFITLWAILRTLPPRTSARHHSVRRSLNHPINLTKPVKKFDEKPHSEPYENIMVNMKGGETFGY